MKFSIKKIALMAMYVSIFVILSKFVSFNLGFLQVTPRIFPFYVAALTLDFGSSCLVAFVGGLLDQLTSGYGITVTTPLWCIPPLVSTIVVAFANIKFHINKFDFKFITIIVVANLIMTILNTAVLYVDSVVYSYYAFPTIFGSFIIKLMSSVVTAIIYCALIPSVVKTIKKIH